MKEIKINKKDSTQRADKYLMRILPSAGKGFIYKMIRKKNIILNDSKMTGNEVLREGDVIKLWFSDETYNKLTQTSMQNTQNDQWLTAYKNIKGINIEYEDDNILIIYKPAGVLSQKSESKDLSVNEWILGYLSKTGQIDDDSLRLCKPSIQNRLDRNTSGLILAGKTLYGINLLSSNIRTRKIHKYYHAYVYGKPSENGDMDGYLKKDENTNKVEILNRKDYLSLPDDIQKIYSNVKLTYNLEESNFDINSNQWISKLEIELLTGKTHQIRAQMAHAGFPLVGDIKYGTDKSVQHTLGQMLCAYKVVFPPDDSFGQLSNKTVYSSKDI